MTIHNIGYQGAFSASTLNDVGLEYHNDRLHQDDLNTGVINFLKTGLLHADWLTTVSPTYAKEIKGPIYGMGLEDVLRTRSNSLSGILNGVDYSSWNPATDTLISANYDIDDMSGKVLCKRALMQEMGLTVDEQTPLIGIITRLTGQKGIDLMDQVLPDLLSKRRVSLAVLGSGEAHYEQFFQTLHDAFPERVGFYRGYNNRLSHSIEAGSDMFLMPSAYEPCGLNQMYSLKYGTVPIVRKTGGLADSVEPVIPDDANGTGVVFEHYDGTGLGWAISHALDLYENQGLWRQVIRNGMIKDFSWQQQGQKYVTLFRQLASS